MSILRAKHALKWVMILSDDGYACQQLQDEFGRRWAWIINAGATTGVLAHVGDWGQARDLGLPPVPLEQELEQFTSYYSAKSWAEEKIADGWKQRNHDLS